MLAVYIQKGLRLLRKKQWNVLRERVKTYLAQKCIAVWYHLTFQKGNGDLYIGAEQWHVYTWLKKKYRGLLAQAPTPQPPAPLTETWDSGGYIWWCWLQGEENAPPLCRQCLLSLRRHFPQKDIVVLTAENLHDYIELPDCIEEKHARGIIGNANYSDLIRTELLLRYGGTWIDATVLCTGPAREIWSAPLFCYKCVSSWSVATAASNWLIHAQPGDPILTLTRQLLYRYWTEHNCTVDYFIFHLCFRIAAEVYRENWDAVPTWSNVPPHILQGELGRPWSAERFEQIRQISDIHKLTYKTAPSVGAGDTFWDRIVSGTTAE